jgi:hypothetical protein
VAIGSLAIAGIGLGRIGAGAGQRSAPTVVSGPASVPDGLASSQITLLSERFCGKGELSTIQAEGATNESDLDQLEPNLAKTLSGIGEGGALADASPTVYAIDVAGTCETKSEVPGAEPQTAVEGYVMFDGSGRPIVSQIWYQGAQPSLTSAFGSDVDAALAGTSAK